MANNSELLEGLSAADIELNKEKDLVKTLGITFDVSHDQFSYCLHPSKEICITKSQVLSEIASIYDPIGWIGPVITTAKLFMKSLWLNNLGWSDELTEDMRNDWQEFRDKLSAVNQVKIPRYCVLDNSLEIELHGFCDASIEAYGAVVYVLSRDAQNNSKTSILCSKSRVAPKNQKTLARLELCSAALLAKLMKRYATTLSIKKEFVTLWSDSTIVLSWISIPSNKLQTFVGNRVAAIQELSHEYAWRHIRTDENPADAISRGMQPHEIVNCDLWWDGPSFFKNKKSEWPQSMITINEQDLEVSKEIKKTFLVTESNELFSYIETRFSSLKKLKNVFAYIQRFVSKTRRQRDSNQPESLSVEEKEKAENQIIKIVQRTMYPDEWKILQDKSQVSRKSSLIALAPFIDTSGIIRVGGRLAASPELSFDQKHPIILPPCNFSKLIIRELHNLYLHPTKATMLSIVSQRFWILKAKSAIRKLHHECLRCFRMKPVAAQQFMSDLPEARVKLTTPFVNSAVDYAGYYLIKTGTTRNAPSTKAYVVMFKCMSTGAIHLDVASDLSTKEFLAVMDRFVSRRGLCVELFSDNATCFEGANNHLKKIVLDMKSDVEKYCCDKSIKWKFTTPRSPSAGGIYESGIKSAKHHLNRLFEKTFTFEQFTTILCKIEAVLNSRPLTPMSEDIEDLNVLTPGHFLIGRPLTAMPQKNFLKTPSNRLAHWEELQQIQQKFWNQWYHQYLLQLQKRPVNFREKFQFELGDMVLVKDENLPPLKWLMGRIIKMFPGKDRVVRNVRVKTQHGEKERNVRYLCFLPFIKPESSS